MAMKYLGETFDIHCGGIDHIPVHHTNEIAQSEATTGKKFVNYWMHGEFLNEDSGKMSKSKGETLTLSYLEKQGFTPSEYRFLLLQAHYRSILMFSFDALKSAQSGFRGLVQRVKEWGTISPAQSLSQAALKYLEEFDASIYNDLNLPEALSVLFRSIKDQSLSVEEKIRLVNSFDEILGLDLMGEAQKVEEVPAHVMALVKARDHARATKNFAESDRLRNELQSLGYKVEDSPQGTKVSKG
jgi:cysteinyl-tRNA synthetase